MIWHFSCDSPRMQAISHAIGTFAPIRASGQQAFSPKPVIDLVAEPIQTQALQAEASKTSGLWEGKSFSFWDILDAINPLQHIPVISTIYRKMSGDDMGYAARITGDTLYSGLFGSLISGLVSSLANVFVDSTTGKDIGEHVVASITPSVKVASAQAPAISPVQTLQQSLQQSIAAVVEPNSALIKQQQTVLLPSVDGAMLQAGIDQYKWQSMTDEAKTRSHYWA